MAYTKQTWADLPSKTTPINAERLTHIEDGIFDAAATADTAASNASSAISGLADKVDKVEGKGLSTNDFTDALKTKLDNVEAGAEVNVQSDWDQSDNSADDYIKNKPSLGTASAKNSTSVVTDSSDLVESGAVYDAIEDTAGWIGGNILPFPYKESSHTHNGIAYTVNSNGTVRAVGTATGNSDFYLFGDEIPSWMESGVDYILSGCPEQPEVESYSIQYNNWTEGESYIRTDTGNGVVIRKITDSNTQKLRIRVYDGKTVNITFKPMISKIKMPFVPYHASVSDSLEEKADNSVIGTVEDGASPTKSYEVGEHMIRGGKFCTVTVAVTTSSTWTLGSNYVEGDVASLLTSVNTTISLVDNTLFSSIKNIVRKYGNVVEVFFECVLDTDKSLADWSVIGNLASGYRPAENTYTVAFVEKTGSGKTASKVLFVSQTGAIQCALALSAGDRLMFQCTFIQNN